jgi:hypothetical protein
MVFTKHSPFLSENQTKHKLCWQKAEFKFVAAGGKHIEPFGFEGLNPI